MNSRNKYPVTNIDRLRMGNDGPGIRTLIVVHGCPLRCKYCINPFTWDGSEKTKMMTAAEIYGKLVIDRPYIMATNGGLTFGGGEPLLYPELINEMRTICEPEMTFYVETSFNVEWDSIRSVTDVVDCFYVDIKSMDLDVYKEYTGGDIVPVIENIRKYIEIKGSDSIIVRIPEIPGFVDAEQQNKAKAELSELGVKRFNLFKYTLPKNK